MKHTNKNIFEDVHLRLEDLKREPDLQDNGYLHKPVPLMPIPLEFQITKVIHVTGKWGMRGILGESGFRLGENAGYGNGTQFLWWSLAVDDADLLPAQHRFLKAFLPHITPEEVENHPEFLSQFTTSTAFQLGSRYGTFKFTFSLQELLQKFSEQLCEGESPVQRVYKTVVYKKEIMHVVVIHSPDVHDFDECPILQDNEDVPCALRDGSLLWRPRAITDPCRRKLVMEEDGRSVRVEELPGGDEKYYFMWEHGALAFHIPPGQTLRFERDELINSLSAC
uniref:Si:ch211-197h24.9 n=1 Tax=Paramormyrops kingsleyae TaxID=1676925 RepID=A0A3B3QK67_9TELE